MGYHRPRCNTEIKLEKMKRDRRNVPKIKTVTWKPAENGELTAEELDTFFPIIENPHNREDKDEESSGQTSLLSFQLANIPPAAPNQFKVFSRFDAASVSAKEKIKTFKVFTVS